MAYKMCHCDLKNMSRSLVIKLLMKIHLSCKFGDSISKLKKVRDVKFCIKCSVMTLKMGRGHRLSSLI